ncbi:TraM recognition domain-containing protein [Candidatus Synchoanobacter obligatus]|uniref:TraM recognition domain-containing protein n=1 Tax=Candidatus Synchoanobacter obligatus TaxID=2919597 RepID=A0ABT1L5B4_9GAMM|nr:TraM recognition domain-containing protein [Candidatus Synchoanobacter obligatus]MCP8352370.1 TraM recognition domain-containing protein [Candidatus Synchoanobacter obligatus]
MRGIESGQEQKTSQLIRDTRSLGQKAAELFNRPTGAAAVIGATTASAVILPAIADILILLNVMFISYTATRKAKLPFRMPQRSKMVDYGNLNPGTGKPMKAEGTYYFGNDKKNQKELWFGDSDMRTHVLIFGSTGSGKTVFLVSLAFNALVQSSGFIYVDGKGDNSLYSSVFSIVRFLGREDDLLLINFMTGAKDIVGPQEKRLSNTLNPFATGSSSMLANLVTGMMDSSSGSGDGDMWKGRAIAFVEALLKVLVAMRDAGHILLDANTIRNYFSLERLEAMADNVFMRDNGEYSIDMSNLPSVVKEPVMNYLSTLPGYNKERKGQQVSQVFEQHGYITMQLTRVFTSLADTYGHILRTDLAEVDLQDVVLNRRILVVLLPALEKSPDELSNLGKVVIASMRSMMASGLGDSVEGDYRDLIVRKPTNAETPFLCILDEYGYYAVKGFAVVPAQARSLGFSVVFAGQDLPAFQKASKEEAASIGANTNIKICMKLEDPTDTWEFFMKGAGEAYVSTVDSFNANQSSLSNSYLDTRSAKMDKRARIDLLDLKDQGLGEAHIFFKSDIVRAKTFYANPPPCGYMQLNQMIKVDMLSDQKLYDLVKGIEDYTSHQIPEVIQVEEDQALQELFALLDKAEGGLIDKSLAILSDMHANKEAQVEEVTDEPVDVALVNVFTRYLVEGDANKKINAILNRKELSSQLVLLLRFFGEDQGSAQTGADVMLDKVEALTGVYTPIGLLDHSAVAAAVDDIENSLKKEEVKSE